MGRKMGKSDIIFSIKLGPWTHSSLQFQLNPYDGVKYLDMDNVETTPTVFTEGSFQ